MKNENLWGNIKKWVKYEFVRKKVSAMCVSQVFIVRVKVVVKSSGSLSIINLRQQIKRGS